jgi:hypothetical protein
MKTDSLLFKTFKIIEIGRENNSGGDVEVYRRGGGGSLRILRFLSKGFPMNFDPRLNVFQNNIKKYQYDDCTFADIFTNENYQCSLR